MFDAVQHLRSAWRLVRCHPGFVLVLGAGIAVSSGFTGTAMTLARALTRALAWARALAKVLLKA